MPPTPAINILAVDDDPQLLRLLCRHLERLLASLPVTIISTVSPFAAYELCGQQPFKLVITDYLMPQMNGLQLARAVKQRSPGSSILLITGFANTALIAEAPTYGVDAVLAKPYTHTQLGDTVKQLLGVLKER
ncbi:MAG: response regulator [Roseiflexaceae bacterium]|nr:response regulator [Roseiflexaceae bacterium]